MDIPELVTALAPRLEKSMIALDFDGTLAPIVVDPATSRPAPGAIDALTTLAARGGQIAVITGRDARTVVRLGSLDAVPGITVAGLYGAETWSDGALQTQPTPPSIDELRARLPDTVRTACTDDDVWIEDKRLSLVVHTRRAADPAAAMESLRGPVARLATELGLELHPGRAVLELRLPGYDKGAVLRRLAEERAVSALLFAGDDLGDLPAFAVTRELRRSGLFAWSVAAGSPDVPEVADAADLHVDGPEGVVALLAELAATGAP